jgi:RimJ/RimL family protein N-acetyltransferase
VRDYAFQELHLSRVVSLIRPDNVASQAVARKLGMEVADKTMHSGLEHLVFAVESRAS